MELILEKDLEHQRKAVHAISSALEGISISNPGVAYENPLIEHQDLRLRHNMLEIQKNIRSDHRGCRDDGNYINLDVKMETGTGKTYVYTHTIYELHRQYGINKFIIAVPSLPIKAGTSQFMRDLYVRRHFANVCGYNCDIELGILESPKSKKKGFLSMPSPIRDFVSGSCQNTNKIYVLIVNMQLLTNGNMLTRSDYDYLVEGFCRPFDALKATRPVVIIDEPHRFSREQKAYQTIVNELCPQMVIRFGATFPITATGSGRNKVICKDFNNLVYELNACDSFYQNLIKGVIKEHFQPSSRREEKVKLVTVNHKIFASFQYKKTGESSKTYTLAKGDSLSLMNPIFEGITISAIGKNYVEFTNGQTKYQGEEFNTDIYSSSYQEQMIKLAIQRHFETERQNFSGRKFKIKTLALFFIDDITAYRDTEEGKKPYLKEIFEHLLLEKMSSLIVELPDTERDYIEYLKASIADIPACHAGYFSQDNNDSDEAVAAEIADILHNKKGLLSLYHSNGMYNIRRFLFSKWTLKEGWDNPNIFTIAKLRSSGSENSRLQEVGRGLRLPVDENGNRISNEEFKLNYIVDFTEADFAQKLVDEINGELPETQILQPDLLDRAAQSRNMDADDLFAELLIKKYINRNSEIRSENRDAFFAEYPEFSSGVSGSKITDRNKKPKQDIHIRKAVYSELEALWMAVNQKYFLFYDKDLDDEIVLVLRDILHKYGVFGNLVLNSCRNGVVVEGNQMALCQETGISYAIRKPLAYHEFLKRICSQTSIPIRLLHQEMIKLSEEKEVPDEWINDYSAANIVREFTDWRIKNTQTRFKYAKISL